MTIESTTPPVDPVDRWAGKQTAPLSRRALLRGTGILAGSVGAGALLAACAQAGVTSWTFPVASAANPDAAAVPSDPTMSMAPAAGASPSAMAGMATSPAPVGGARDPSPADFASPPRYHPASSTPIAFDLTSNDGPGETILISASPATAYRSMNFGRQVPAPTLRITEGETVHFTLTNQGQMPHSIDFHAAQTAWSTNYQEIAPGGSFSFAWTANYPGVFMYHCGAAPVLMHMADGMYGAIIVDPKVARPAAREYLLVQSEFYGSGGEYAKMLNNPPDFVVFNGQANRYKATPLIATAGELVRIYLVNAGPNSSSAFHVIGALFSHVEADGNPANRTGMRQTIDIPPGDGAMVELTFAEPGTYPFVTHRFCDASKGALGMFKVS
jgi:nitrite reductase (NO-forming)